MSVSKYLVQRVHEQGINMRYLGRIRLCCQSDEWYYSFFLFFIFYLFIYLFFYFFIFLFFIFYFCIPLFSFKIDCRNAFLLIEMVGRIIKRKTNILFHEILSQQKTDYGIENLLTQFTHFLNLIFGESELSEEFWHNTIYENTLSYFKTFMTEEETNKEIELYLVNKNIFFLFSFFFIFINLLFYLLNLNFISFYFLERSKKC